MTNNIDSNTSQKNVMSMMMEFLAKSSAFGISTVVFFSIFSNLFLFYLNKYWLDKMGIKYPLNIFEAVQVTSGILIFNTAGLIIFYAFILLLIFSFIRDGLELLTAWTDKLKNKDNVLMIFFYLPLVFLVIAVILENTLKDEPMNLLLLFITTFFFFFFVLQTLKSPLAACIDKLKNISGAVKPNRSKSKWFNIVLFSFIGFLIPGLIIHFLEKGIPYWMFAYFVCIVLSAHVVASFYSLGGKSFFYIALAVLFFSILALAGWFDLLAGHVTRTRDLILNKDNTSPSMIEEKRVPIFPNIISGYIYVENPEFLTTFTNSKMKNFAKEKLRDKMLYDVNFIVLKGINYVFVPTGKDSIGILEVKDGKIMKLVASDLDQDVQVSDMTASNEDLFVSVCNERRYKNEFGSKIGCNVYYPFSPLFIISERSLFPLPSLVSHISFSTPQ